MIDPSAFVIKPDPSVVAQYRVTFIAFMLTYFVPLAIAACVQCELLWHKQTMLSLISFSCSSHIHACGCTSTCLCWLV